MKDFQTLIVEWLEAQLGLYQQAIEKRKGDYLKKKWPWTESAVSDFNRRIENLTALHASVLSELTFGKVYGEDLLNLANLIFNEAGTANRSAKVAIAYAWLNRTKGVMREPKNAAEVSYYIPLVERWNGLTDIDRLTFLQNFAICLSAARQRLGDGEATKNDPTQGSTHWVSPISLPGFKGGKGSYQRTVGKAVNRAFPTWARSNSDPELAKMKKNNQVQPTYLELSVVGVDQASFLFYKGVNY